MLTFNAIDVETANADRASICQIGLVHIQDGKIQDQWKTLINPEDWFDPWNIEIHGIDEAAVSGSPTLPEARNEALKPWAAEGISRRTWYRRKKRGT